MLTRYTLAVYGPEATDFPWRTGSLHVALVTMEVRGENNEHRDGVVDRSCALFRCSEAKILSVEDLETGAVVEVARSYGDHEGCGSYLVYRANKSILSTRDTSNPNAVLGCEIHYRLTRRALEIPYPSYIGIHPRFDQDGKLTTPYVCRGAEGLLFTKYVLPRGMDLPRPIERRGLIFIMEGDHVRDIETTAFEGFILE